eukprot:15453050-Alexandrium_andersonii.AAC.1
MPSFSGPAIQIPTSGSGSALVHRSGWFGRPPPGEFSPRLRRRPRPRSARLMRSRPAPRAGRTA